MKSIPHESRVGRHPVARVAALAAATALLQLLPTAAQATNGYFSHGYGAKSQGAGGVGVAWFQDALAPAANPAGLAFVGNRADLGLTWFRPARSAQIAGNAFGADASYNGDGKKNFFFPDLGYTHQISPSLALGIALYGNGGLNTEYRNNPFARFGASGTAGVNLEQLFITPALAWKPSEKHSLGVALNVAHQRFSAQGLGFFNGFSQYPGQVSDHGTDTDTSAGLRLGWAGEVAPGLTLGATWASKIKGRFDSYRGLFAGAGSFDIPENYALGLAWRATPAWTVAADVQHIRYSQVRAVGTGAEPLFQQGVALGAANGAGFGWRDLTVLKLGVDHRLHPSLVLRGGASFANQVVPRSQTFFNTLAPGVVRKHLTVGFTWTMPGGGELTGFYAHAFGETVHGSGSIPAGFPPQGFGGGNVNVRLKEHIAGVSYGWKF